MQERMLRLSPHAHVVQAACCMPLHTGQLLVIQGLTATACVPLCPHACVRACMGQMRDAKRADERARAAAEKAAKDAKRLEQDLKSYKHIMKDEYMVSNAEMREKYQSVEEMEEDFM